PRSATALISLLGAHAGPGTAAAMGSAISAYDRVQRELEENHGVSVDPSVTAAAAALRDRLARLDQARASQVAMPTSTAEPVTAAARRTTGTREAVRTSRRWSLAAIAVASVAVIVAFWALRRPSVVAAESKLPIIAVTSIDDVRGDSSLDWLRLGLPR